MDTLRTVDKGRAFFTEGASTRMFDLACGTDKVRKAFQAGADARILWAIFNEGRDAFMERRKPYLLYE